MGPRTENKVSTSIRAYIAHFFSMTPSEGENELLSRKEQSFQKVHFGKRKSLWAFSRNYTQVSSLTRSSIYRHRRWVHLSIIIKTLKITSIKKRSWSSKIMLDKFAKCISNTTTNTFLICLSFETQFFVYFQNQCFIILEPQGTVEN